MLACLIACSLAKNKEPLWLFFWVYTGMQRGDSLKNGMSPCISWLSHRTAQKTAYCDSLCAKNKSQTYEIIVHMLCAILK